jgi:hypothetical protein
MDVVEDPDDILTTTKGQEMKYQYRGSQMTTILLGLLLGSLAMAADDFPDTTTEGLKRIDSKKADVVYWQDGATLEGYQRIGLLDCYVAFRKDWERDQNRNRQSLGNRVSDEDMERIKKDLAAEFRKVFTKELTEKGGYEMTATGGADVLILRPAIINLDVLAPDLDNLGRVENFVSSAGAMTLYLELYDGATGALIARIIDERDDNRGFAQRANSVTNKAAADRILRTWADALRGALDDAHEVKN